jgi:hypothetical protein
MGGVMKNRYLSFLVVCLLNFVVVSGLYFGGSVGGCVERSTVLEGNTIPNIEGTYQFITADCDPNNSFYSVYMELLQDGGDFNMLPLDDNFELTNAQGVFRGTIDAAGTITINGAVSNGAGGGEICIGGGTYTKGIMTFTCEGEDLGCTIAYEGL